MATKDESSARIFISYATADRSFADRIALALRAKGFEAFIDHDSLRGGDRWLERLEQEIQAARALVLCGSPASFQSKYVKWELGVAFSAAKLVVPCQIAPIEGIRPLDQIQWIDFTADWAQASRKLIEALAPVSSAWPANQLAARIEDVAQRDPELALLVGVAAFDAYGRSARLERAVRNVSAGWKQRAIARHAGSVVSVSLSADGRRFLSASLSGTAILLDLSTEKSQTLIKIEAPLTCTAFAPGGRALVASLSGQLWVFDNTGQQIFEHTTTQLTPPEQRPDWPADMKHGAPMILSEGTVGATDTRRFQQGITTATFDSTGDSIFIGLINGIVQRIHLTDSQQSWARWPHRDSVVHLELDEIEKRLATASMDATAAVLNITSGAWKRFAGHGQSITAATFHPTQNLLFTGCNDGQLRSIDLETAAIQLIGQPHDKKITALRVSRDGKELLSTSADNTARLHVIDQPTIRRIFRHPAGALDAFFIEGVEQIATICEDAVIRTFDVAEGTLIHQLPNGNDPPRSSAWQEDHDLLAIGTLHGAARVTHHKTTRRPQLTIPFEHRVTAICFSPDDRHLLIASADGAHLFDASTGAILHNFDHHQRAVRAARFDRHGRRILTAGEDGFAAVHDASSGKLICTLAAAEAGNRRLFDPHTGQVLHEYRGTPCGVLEALFTPDEQHIITAAEDRSLRVFDANTGVMLACWTAHRTPVTSLDIFDDGTRIATTAADATIRVANLQGQELLLISVERGHEPVYSDGQLSQNFRGARIEPSALKVEPGGLRLLVGFNSNPTEVFDTATGASLAVLDDSGAVTLQPSPEGTRILTAGRDGLAIFELATCALLMRIPGHIRSAVFDPTGTRVLVAAGAAGVFDAENGELLAMFDEPEARAHVATFNSDGTTIALAGRTNIRLIEYPPLPRLLEQARHRAQRELTAEERRGFGLPAV